MLERIIVQLYITTVVDWSGHFSQQQLTEVGGRGEVVMYYCTSTEEGGVGGNVFMYN